MGRIPIVLDCSCLSGLDAAEVDRIARLHLALLAQGFELRLRNPPARLIELIGFCGLLGVLRIESGGEAEEREQPPDVEEEGELGDAAV